MIDIKTIWSRDLGSGDWLIPDVAGAGSEIETAILISLFTDREALPDDAIPDGTGDPRGWIGDAGQQYKIGSRIWLLSRAKQTAETLRRASDYIAEALQWMIDDGVVTRFDVTAEWVRTSTLGAQISAHLPASAPTQGSNFPGSLVPSVVARIGIDFVLGVSPVY